MNLMNSTGLTPSMIDALIAIWAHESAGSWGAPVDSIQPRTFVALSRRGLIESKPHHGVRLTAEGRAAVGS